MISTLAAGTTWKVGDVTPSRLGRRRAGRHAPGVNAQLGSGHAALPVELRLHTLQSFSVAADSFTALLTHEYPSYLELRLTATDSGGLTTTTTRRLDPRTVVLT